MRIWLIIQFVALLCATTVAAGGGQFPGNVAHMLIYIKFVLFMVPVCGCLLMSGYKRSFYNWSALSHFIRDHGLLLAFLISLILSVPLSAYPFFSLQRCLYTYLGFASLFCLLLQYRLLPASDKVYILSLQTISLILLGCIGVAWATLPLPGLRWTIQYAGLVHPNMLSSLLAQCVLGLLFLPLTSAQRWYSAILILGLSIGIIGLQSRGVWISLSVALIVCLVIDSCLYHSKRSLLIFLGVMLFASLTTMILLLSPDLLHDALTLISRGQPLADMLTLTNRIALWKTLFADLSVKQMLIGHGYALMTPYVTVDFGTGILYGAHSAYLSILLGTGLFSLLLLLSYWVVILIRLYRPSLPFDKYPVLLVTGSLALLMTHAIVAEEFGLHLTPTFMLLLVYTQRALAMQDRS